MKKALRSAPAPATPAARLQKAATREGVLHRFKLEGDSVEDVTTLQLGTAFRVMITMAGFAAQEIPRDRLGNLIGALEAIDPEDALAKKLRTEKRHIEHEEAGYAKMMKAAEITDAAPAGDTRSQAEKFEQAARDLDCDEDDERFKGVLRKLAKAKPA